MYQPPPIPTFLLRSDARKHAQTQNLNLGEIDLVHTENGRYTYRKKEDLSITVQPEPKETLPMTAKKTAKRTRKAEKPKEKAGKTPKTLTPKRKAVAATPKRKPHVDSPIIVTVLAMLKTGATMKEMLAKLPEGTGSGYIGALVTKRLAKRGHTVLITKPEGSKHKVYKLAA